MASALALEDENRYEEALEIYEEVERFQDERREHRLFKENRTLLENLKTLMETLYVQDRYSDAIAVAQEILKIQESDTETEGSDYFDKLTTLQALGTLYQLQGDDIKALLTYNRVFALEDASR
ncbi:MAG: tetratricopeptide repeat protein [Phormidesmis sp.]